MEYAAAAPSYEAAAAPDLTPIIIGILVLTGLSLLFPTYVTISGTGRKRRSVVDGVVYGEEGECNNSFSCQHIFR